jgi:hypothetical protein
VSWTFQPPANDESTAILIPNATPQSLKIIAYNLSQNSVMATMTAWNLEPGRWEIVQGVDNDGDDIADGPTSTSRVDLERTGTIELTFPSRVNSVVSLKLVSKGTPYWSRPDLGIGKDDIAVHGRTITVTVHSLGGVDAPRTNLALIDRNGNVLSSVAVPALKSPGDLMPKTATVTLTIPVGGQLDGATIVIDPEATLKEITRINNRVRF